MNFNDPAIDQINYNKELFDYLKKIFPDAKPFPKRELYQNRQLNRKLKASIIICLKPDCNYRCVEHQDRLIDHFLRHVKKAHHITPSSQFVENLKVIFVTTIGLRTSTHLFTCNGKRSLAKGE